MDEYHAPTTLFNDSAMITVDTFSSYLKGQGFVIEISEAATRTNEVNKDADSQDGTEPAGIKTIPANSNGEVTWIDDEGSVRIWHDDNYQMVTFTSASDVELKMDSWDANLACNMIVFGDDIDNTLSIEYGLTQCPHGTHGNDRARHSLTVTNRFLKLANSAIAIGRLKEHDTPANWMTWAKTKGYSVAHLNPAIQIEALQLAIQDCPDDCPSLRDSYRERLEQWQAIADTPPQAEAVPDAGKIKKKSNDERRHKIAVDWYADKGKPDMQPYTNETIKNMLCVFSCEDDKSLWTSGGLNWVNHNGNKIWGVKQSGLKPEDKA